MTEQRYGQWAENPNGNPEDPNRCIAEVKIQWLFRERTLEQCLRKRGHGPGGLYCKQHAKMVEPKEVDDG